MSERRIALGEIEFPTFYVPKEDLPKVDVIGVQLFQDGSIVYERNGQLIGELPSIGVACACLGCQRKPKHGECECGENCNCRCKLWPARQESDGAR